MNKTIVGLDSIKTEVLALELNTLLANFQVYYQSLRGLHWNIKGRNFFELHAKFEELYTDTQEKVDIIAERILTLQGKPLHTFDAYMKIATVPVVHDVSNDVEGVKLVIESLRTLLKIERVILSISADADDEGTNGLMSDFISEQEKILWMMNAWLS